MQEQEQEHCHLFPLIRLYMQRKPVAEYTAMDEAMRFWSVCEVKKVSTAVVVVTRSAASLQMLLSYREKG